MYVGLHVKYPIFLLGFNEAQQDYRKIKRSNFMKIHPLGAELFHAGGRTDRHTFHDVAYNRFSQFCQSAQREWWPCCVSGGRCLPVDMRNIPKGLNPRHHRSETFKSPMHGSVRVPQGFKLYCNI
jgi:hypothetical protein